MEDSIFTRIIKGEIPCHKIYEDEQTIAFLTIQPFAPGHTLVVPKHQVDQIWDLEDDEYIGLMTVVKKLGLHIRTTLGAQRVGIVVKGFEVPHVHVHLIPANRGEHVNFDPANPEMADKDVLAELADKLRLS